MARTNKMTKAAAKAKSAREAAELQAHLEAKAYDQLTDAQLNSECKKRLLLSFDRYHMLNTLKRDDGQRAALSTNEYAAVLFVRSNKLPPYRLWDRAAQIERIQRKRDYRTRFIAAEKATTHNDSLKPSLMTLPPEIRNPIYFDLFTAAPGIVQNHCIHPFVLTSHNEGDKRIVFGHEHALLRTCKAIRIDALPMWYGNREYRFTQDRTHLKRSYDILTFALQVDHEVMALFERWASLLGDGRLDMIRNLHLELDYVTFTIKDGVVHFHQTPGLGYAVKDVPAVGRAIWSILRRHMNTTKMKASGDVAQYLRGC